MKHAQQGFTLIELVIVIVILGILAATALPRFISVTDDAHEAAVAGAGGGVGSAVSLVRAQWVADGGTASGVDLDNADGDNDSSTGADVAVNSSGWPIGTDGTLNDAADCVDVWNAIMQNPPSVSATAGSADYYATFSGTACTFDYEGISAANDLDIVYDTNDGSVVIDDAKDGS